MDANEPEVDGAYTWEEGYAEGLSIRQVLQENEQGSLEDSIRRMVQAEKRQRRLAERPSSIRLGNIRYVYICVDCSLAMLSENRLEGRMEVTLRCLLAFLEKFFEQNPLSQLGIIACRNKRAERLIGFSSSPHALKEAVQQLREGEFLNGEFSLQAGLQLVLQSFQALPAHSSKEVIFLIGSLTTIDGGSVANSAEQLKMRSVKCSAIGMGGAVHIYRHLCSTTGGTYAVRLDNAHMEMLLMDHVPPPIASREQESSIVKMGFPKRCAVKVPSFCMTHLDDTADERDCNQHRAFFCPRCTARFCQTPIECKVCGLLLLTAPQLARAHQHLQPLGAFAERSPDEGSSCFSCSRPFALEVKCYACKKCETEFCIECDLLLHESLQICPACG